MKLLICTQKVDINDPILGFFHRWLEEFAKHCESVIVICLEKGEYHLPEKVKILSLGKEENKSKLKYLINFFKYIWRERKNYDGVFVHMNPEYCILGGIFWRLWRKKILLWYTHKAVNWRLHLGTLFANKIFTASKESFRLSSKKVEVVGHGIPIEIFSNQSENIPAGQLCLLAVGRASPSKDFETAIKAVQELKNKKNLPPTKFVIESTKNYSEMPKVYHNHHILIHTSRTGSMDKVVLEAMASGRIVVTSSEAFTGLAKDGLVYAFPAGDYQELAKLIEDIYNSVIIKQIPNQFAIEYVRRNHNLSTLIDKIISYYVISDNLVDL